MYAIDRAILISLMVLKAIAKIAISIVLGLVRFALRLVKAVSRKSARGDSGAIDFRERS